MIYIIFSISFLFLSQTGHAQFPGNIGDNRSFNQIGISFESQSEHERYTFLNNEQSQNEIAKEIAFDIFVLSKQNNFSASKENSILKTYGLNEPGYHDIRDKILGKALLKLSLPTAISSINPETGKYTFTFEHQNGLSNLQKQLEAQGVPLPSNFIDAIDLDNISKEHKDDHSAFLKAVSERFSGKTLTQIAFESQNAYPLDKVDKIQLIKTMAKGEIDQNFLYNVVSNQLDASTTSYNHKFFVPGLLEEAMKYFDINHTHSGNDLFSGSTLACSLSQTIYGNTDQFGATYGFKYSDFNETNPPIVQKQIKEFQKNQIVSYGKQLEILFKHGANFNQPCSNGMTPNQMIKVIQKERIIDLTNFAFYAVNTPLNCEHSNEEIPQDLCLSVDIIFELKKQITRNEKKLSSLDIYGTTKKDCTFLLLQEKMASNNLAPIEKYELEISKKDGAQYIITAKTKEKFLEKLNELLTQEEVRMKKNK
jgi:hypothetical protein